MTTQERYEELKAIPYVKRNGEQRKEYDQLKATFEGDVDSALPPEPSTETVTVKKSSLEALVSRVENLEKLNTSNERKLGMQAQEGKWMEQQDKPKIHTATFKVYRETASGTPSIAVDWKYERDQWDVNKQSSDQMYIITLQDPEGRQRKLEMKLSDFGKLTERIQIQILKRDVTNMVKIDGYVRQQIVKENFDIEQGGKVPYKVIEQKAICRVKLPMDAPWGGQEFDINENRLNA